MIEQEQKKNRKKLVAIIVILIVIMLVIMTLVIIPFLIPKGDSNNSASSDDVQVGDIISYTPSGTYTWDRQLAESGEGAETGKITLDSSTNNYKFTTWMVLTVDGDEIEIVPVSEENHKAEATQGKVTLMGAQGYNNGVKLLDDACSELYGNSKMGITARNMKIEDVKNIIIESGDYETWNKVTEDIYTKGKGGLKKGGPMWYPSIYAKEKISVLEGTKDKQLDVSEQEEFITANQDKAKDGIIFTDFEVLPDDRMLTFEMMDYIEERYWNQIVYNENIEKYFLSSRTTFWSSAKSGQFVEYGLIYIQPAEDGNAQDSEISYCDLLHWYVNPDPSHQKEEASFRPVVKLKKDILETVEKDNIKYKVPNELISNEENTNSDEIEIANVQVGDVVSYTPEGTYAWDKELAESGDGVDTGKVTLDSSTEEFKLTTWRVLTVKEDEIKMVPAQKDNDGNYEGKTTSGLVRLAGAQGYNNGVKLLDDACNSLYGNEKKGITARNIKIEDIESAVIESGNTKKWANEIRKNYTKKSKNTITNDYSLWYPAIYAKEQLNVIDGIENKEGNGLKMSEQKEFILSSQATKEASDSIIPTDTRSRVSMDDHHNSEFLNNLYFTLLANGTNGGTWLSTRNVSTDDEGRIAYYRIISSSLRVDR